MKALSWAYLAFNRKDDAINVAQHALELVPSERDAVIGSGNLARFAEIRRGPALRRRSRRV